MEKRGNKNNNWGNMPESVALIVNIPIPYVPFKPAQLISTNDPTPSKEEIVALINAMIEEEG